ncbi:nb-arc and tpr domain-containing protein [Podospora didyma]|uniref:Nb-arc and tpr domain-containing protein n=1 Tax=Podospora didyma TaxID=330526 RepID=A0AAE0K2U4_9PEZI|nr:nb-arc and tpr domain-containing protein [Podospora didyma]
MPSNNRAQEVELSRRLRDKAPVAAQFEYCFQASIRLTDALQANKPHWRDLRNHAHDCKDRLRSWGDDSGASSRTIDYALRNSPKVARQTRHLLSDLILILEQAVTAVSPQLPEGDDAYDSKDDNDKAVTDPGAWTDTALDDQDADSGPGEYLEEAIDIVACLVKLLPTLRDPLDEDGVEWVAQTGDGYSAESYIQTATDLFPVAPKTLRERLGKANWRRRQTLQRVRERSKHLVLPGNPTKSLSVPRNHPARSSRLPSSKSSTWAADSDASTSTVTTNYAETVTTITPNSDRNSNSGTSMTDSHHLSLLQRLVPPAPPVDLEKVKHFQCPNCYFELPLTVDSSMTLDEWTDHVFLDLKPYMCTFDNCSHANKTFGVRSEWFQHELNFHRSRILWSCGICRSDDTCRSEFDTQADFITHLRTSHSSLRSENLAPILDSCKRYSQDEPLLQCTLCGDDCISVEELENHLGYHLETFSLVATLDIDSSSSSDDGGTRDDEKVRDYLADLAISGDEAPATEPKTARAPSPSRPAPPDTADPSDVSILDDFGREARRKNVPYFEKVQTFLEKQAVQVPSKPVRSNLPDRIDGFVGRTDDLQAIHDCLDTKGGICTITGRGGIGKTAVATEYVHRFEAEYSYIFWVESDLPGTAQQKYNQIETLLDMAEKPIPDENGRTILVRRCLARIERRWLLVFDNVAQWNDIAQYVPKNLLKTNGSVLITSRSGPLLSGVPNTHHQDGVVLEPWGLDHSREFLLTSIDSKLSKNNLQAHEEYELAEKVVEVGGGLPLAVSMIVGYIKVSKCSLADFLEMWAERASRRRPKKQRRVTASADVDLTIDALWEIGIREVRANCRKLLDVLAFLDPETIPKSLLVGDHDEDYLDFLHADETLRYKRMIHQLSRQRLITIKQVEDGDAYFIHRVLQQKILFDLDDFSFADAFRKAFRLIRKKYPRAYPTQVPITEDMDTCRKYMPHLHSFHQAYQEHFSDHKVAPLGREKLVKLAELFYDAGFYVWGAQTTAYDGLTYLESADQILNDIHFDPDDKLRADIHCMMGLLLLNMGYAERRKGTARLKSALHIREKIYEKDKTYDNDVLYQNAANDYALCLMNQYHFDEAGRMMRNCFERYKVWGPEEENPFENSKFYGNNCIVLLWENQIEKAIWSAERSLKYTETFTGGKRSQYYRRLFLLACILLQKGDVQGALNKHMETLDARLEIHGKHHEFTILSTYAVGAAFHYLGDHEKAIEYIRRCISTARSSRWSKEALGRAQYHLALLYEEQGSEDRDDEIKELKAAAMEVLEEFRHYIPRSIRETGDIMMMFDDMQPTFQGRYTGRTLLPHIQARSKQQQGRDQK